MSVSLWRWTENEQIDSTGLSDAEKAEIEAQDAKEAEEAEE